MAFGQQKIEVRRDATQQKQTHRQLKGMQLWQPGPPQGVDTQTDAPLHSKNARENDQVIG
jgi:hypothetical protein